MTQYIDKSALVAEIERRKNKNQQICTAEGSGAFYEDGFILDVINSLDTLEVKDVNLDKELNEFIEQQKAFIKDDRVVEYYNGDSFNHDYDIYPIAEHFFELGLKVAQKGE